MIHIKYIFAQRSKHPTNIAITTRGPADGLSQPAFGVGQAWNPNASFHDLVPITTIPKGPQRFGCLPLIGSFLAQHVRTFLK